MEPAEGSGSNILSLFFPMYAFFFSFANKEIPFSDLCGIQNLLLLKLTSFVCFFLLFFLAWVSCSLLGDYIKHAIHRHFLPGNSEKQ